MKKQAICVLAILLATAVTGCGSKRGVSSPDKAAKLTIEAAVNNDVDVLMNLIPEETLQLFEDEYALTENQIRNEVENSINEELKERKIKVSGIKVKNKKEEEDYSNLNKRLNKHYGVIADKAYDYDVEYKVDRKTADKYNDGERKMENSLEGPIFEIDGKWYSAQIIEQVEDIID